MEVFCYIMGTVGVLLWILMCVFSLVGHHRDLAIWTACLAVICHVIAGFAWYQDHIWKLDEATNPQGASRPPEAVSKAIPDISIDEIVAFATTTPKANGPFWAIDRSIPDTAVVVPLLVYVRIKNVGATPLSIAAYTMEAMENGAWNSIESIDCRNVDVVCYTDPNSKQCIAFDFTKNGVDYLLEKGEIPPGGHIDCWMLFRRLVKADKRLHFIDSNGVEFFKNLNPKFQVNTAPDLNRSYLQLADTKKDISGIKFLRQAP